MSTATIRILLADDHRLIRESWKNILENNLRFRVVADCDNNESAIRQAQELLPDIMLIDINMLPEKGFRIATQVVRDLFSVKVIGISVNNQPKYAIRMVELGAKGFFTKTSSLEEIIHGITEVNQGSTYICEEVRKYLPPA